MNKSSVFSINKYKNKESADKYGTFLTFYIPCGRQMDDKIIIFLISQPLYYGVFRKYERRFCAEFLHRVPFFQPLEPHLLKDWKAGKRRVSALTHEA